MEGQKVDVDERQLVLNGQQPSDPVKQRLRWHNNGNLRPDVNRFDPLDMGDEGGFESRLKPAGDDAQHSATEMVAGG
jgi:hypothetical protein